MLIIDTFCSWAAALIISEPGRICHHGDNNKGASGWPRWSSQGKDGVTERKTAPCPANTSLGSTWALRCVWVGERGHLCAAPRLRRRHITSSNYKMPEEKRKEKEQLFLLPDMKTNQLRKVLWWAKCVLRGVWADSTSSSEREDMNNPPGSDSKGYHMKKPAKYTFCS